MTSSGRNNTALKQATNNNKTKSKNYTTLAINRLENETASDQTTREIAERNQSVAASYREKGVLKPRLQRFL